jgi:type II secretory ATPase GspE/PulE/Tfp pilus assembly ATPase PilB-like protein
MNASFTLRRHAGFWLLIASAAWVSVAFGDTVRLKDGTVLEGNITSEDPFQITIITEHAGGTIFRPETIRKSDIAEITRLSATERRQREMLQAFGKIQNYRLDPQNTFPAAHYHDVIENHLRPFLTKYPDSPHANTVAEKLALWEAERARVVAGEAKPRGQWMPAEKAAALCRAEKCLQQAGALISQRRFEEAVQQLQSVSENGATPEVVAEIRKQLAEAYRLWVASIQQRQQQLDEAIRAADARVQQAQRASELAQRRLAQINAGDVRPLGYDSFVADVQRTAVEAKTAEQAAAQLRNELNSLSSTLLALRSRATAAANAAAQPVAVAAATPPSAPAPSLPAAVETNAAPAVPPVVAKTGEPAEPDIEPAPLNLRFEAGMGVLAFAFCLYLVGLLWVNSAAKNIGASPRLWNTVALVFNVPGIAAFGVAYYMKRRGRSFRIRKTPIPVPVRSDATSYFRVKGAPSMAVLDAAGRPVAMRTDRKTKPVFEAVRAVLAHAIDSRASDIHIEPTENDVLMRLRVDGSFLPKQLLGRDMGIKAVASLKAFANVDVADRRKSQDGRFQVNYGGRIVDFRLATSNSIFGENVVMRLLDRSTGIKSLEALGMSERVLEEFQAALKVPGGMILVAGPTGSGKTTTVYAALSRFDPATRKIVTVEDPVEYELPGATQIPVNVKAGVSYEEGLKSVMRQDPDIILVGEMRSKEATEIAIRAALTGHLVFSTVHAQSALGTILRLRDMGIEPYLISSAVIAVVSQRLVRMLCPKCKLPAAPDGATEAALGAEGIPASAICRPVGCADCGGTGFKGRIGVFEILSLDQEAKRMIVAGASEDELLTHARRQGMRSMREDVHAKILEGITTLQEAALSMKA